MKSRAQKRIRTRRRVLVSLEHVVEVLGVSERSARRYRKEWEKKFGLRPVRYGRYRRPLYFRADLNECIRRHREIHALHGTTTDVDLRSVAAEAFKHVDLLRAIQTAIVFRDAFYETPRLLRRFDASEGVALELSRLELDRLERLYRRPDESPKGSR